MPFATLKAKRPPSGGYIFVSRLQNAGGGPRRSRQGGRLADEIRCSDGSAEIDQGRGGGDNSGWPAVRPGLRGSECIFDDLATHVAETRYFCAQIGFTGNLEGVCVRDGSPSHCIDCALHDPSSSPCFKREPGEKSAGREITAPAGSSNSGQVGGRAICNLFGWPAHGAAFPNGPPRFPTRFHRSDRSK